MRKIVVILRTIFIVIILLFATLIFVPNIMGIEPSIDLIGMMNPTIPKGSITYLNKKTKYEDLKVNDIISINKYNQKSIVRIVSKDEKNKTYSVKGDAESKQDIIVITKKDYYGKQIFSIPKIGVIVLFMQRNFFITLILVILILISLIVDFIKYKNIDITKTLKIISINKQKENTIKEKPVENQEKEIKVESNKITKKEEKEATEKRNKNKVVMKNQDLTAEILDEKEVKEIIELLDSHDNKKEEKEKSEKAEILYTLDEEDKEKKKDDDIEVL